MENRLGVHQNIVLFKYAEFFVGQNVTETAHTFTFAALYVENKYLITAISITHLLIL